MTFGRHKYGAKRTEVDGISFASKKEAARYVQLKALQKAGKVRSLVLQKEYRLEVNGQLICRYRADFVYEGQGTFGVDYFDGVPCWITVVEDVKGYRTPEYKLKAKLMRACHGIEIREV